MTDGPRDFINPELVGAPDFWLPPAGFQAKPAQPSLFAVQRAAIERGEAGMDEAIAKLTPEECRGVNIMIDKLAATGQNFTWDDIFFGLPVWLQDRLDNFAAASGGFTHKAAKARRIEKTGSVVPSTRPRARGRLICVWRGVSR